MAGPGGPGTTTQESSGFESFPISFDGEEESTPFSTLKRFFTSSSSTSSLSTQSTAVPSFPQLPDHGSSESPPIVGASSFSRGSSFSARHSLQSIVETGSTSSSPVSSHATLPNGRRYVRSIRLSGVSPSVRLSVAHSEKGDLVQSGSSRTIASDYGYGSDAGSTGGRTGQGRSPASESFGATLANLSSIPGFPLSGKELADDSRSIRSVSSVTWPSASAAVVFRKLRGEGLSKEYWMNDESATECVGCHTVFTAFRRKHHCRICGQIFCSRCASNIIPGRRFGVPDLVRICNLCLAVSHESDLGNSTSGYAPNPDHPSPTLPATTSRFPRSTLRESSTSTYLSISAPLEASARPPQSQFAASHLFPRTETPYQQYLSASRLGAMGGRRGGIETEFDGDRASSRGDTPGDESDDQGSTTDSPRRRMSMAQGPSTTAAAPFRRNLAEEDKAVEESGVQGLGIAQDGDEELELEGLLSRRPSVRSVPAAEEDDSEELPMNHRRRRADSTSVRFSSEVLPPYPAQAKKSIAPALPPSLPSQPQVAEVHPDHILPTISSPVSNGDLSISSPTSASNSAFITFELSNESSSAPTGPYCLLPPRRSSGLSPPTMAHLRNMLRQSLQRASIPNASAWESELLKLLVQVAKYPAPNVRAGDNMDIRRYVHIKKIPGGHPRHSEYVDGIVFTKNIVAKQMARVLSNPRIMLLSFPLEYQRVENQLMSLDPLIKQEREYLRNLVARIVTQRPHIILVERNVSRLALEYLMEANIAVARNVKPEVINAVARVTQADVISSMDKLALEPRLGRCGTFRVQTFVHSMIPGRRKTFMRFEGCAQDLGCTLVLRGGSIDVLSRIKKIVDTMVLIVHSAKLEDHLLRDELVVPAGLDQARPPTYTACSDLDDVAPELFLNDLDAQDRERVSNDISRALNPYQKTALSGSPWVQYPPPYPLARMSEEDRRVTALRRLREYEEAEQRIQEVEQVREEEEKVEREREQEREREKEKEKELEVEKGEETSTISVSSSTASLQSLTQSEHSERSDAATTASTLANTISTQTTNTSTLLTLATMEAPGKVLQTSEQLARATQFREAEERHTEQLAVWDAYVSRSKDSLDPADHQKLIVLETLSCSQTDHICAGPSIRTISFYGQNDVSVGQFVEGVCLEAGKTCNSPGCGRHMMVHWRTWVHGPWKVFIVPEAHLVTLENPDFEGEIVMWSWCRRCQKKSSQAVMSDETYGLSFGKYLELCFYAKDLVRSDGECTHNGHLDHIRYWTYRGLSLQVSLEPVKVYDVVAPPLILRTRPEMPRQLRNLEYVEVLTKSNAFWASIVNRIQSFNYDLVAADRLEEAHVAMDERLKRCEVDRCATVRLLDVTYDEAAASNSTEMTAVRRALQNKAVEWEGDFAALEQRIIPSEKEVRRLTTAQLKRLFSDDKLPLSPERRTTSSVLAPSIEADEKDEKHDETEEPLTSSSIGTDSSRTSTPACSLSSESTAPPSPITIAPTTPVYVTSLASSSILPSSDNESDSTVCADPPLRAASPFATRGAVRGHYTSGGESDQDTPTPMRRKNIPGLGVAGLVRIFDEGDSPTDRRTPTNRHPTVRRGVSEKPKSFKARSGLEVLSDGDSSYARNVGVSHLSTHSFAEKPSRIPQPSLARLFDPPPIVEKVRLAPTTSHSLSRPPSRTDESRPSRPASYTISRESFESTGSRRPRGGYSSPSSVSRSNSKDGVTGKGKARANEFGLSRPTTSSTNKAAMGSVRRVSGPRVAKISNIFNKKAHEEKERRRRLAQMHGPGAKRAPRPVAVAQPTIEVFDNICDAVREDEESEDERDRGSSDGADDEYDDEGEHARSDDEGQSVVAVVELSKNVSEPLDPPADPEPVADPAPSSIVAVLLDNTDTVDIKSPAELEPPSVPPSPRLGDGFGTVRLSEGESSGNERGSIIKAISSLWTYRGAEYTPLAYPLLLSEHVFADNPILLREDEPSSIIAFTLSSKAYCDKIKGQEVARVIERTAAFMPDEVQPGDRSSTWGVLDFNPDGNDVEEMLRNPGGKHMKFQFEEGTTTFSCKIFFAEQFDALRRNCGCSSQFIESLARCKKWESSGGKSNVDFLKTSDDRFIIKEVSRSEMDSLLKFAPAYFEYMSKAFFHGLPTMLAKIYGFYRIALKNTVTGKKIGVDVLVMENLFYERNLEKVFDLKGSTRNRHVVKKENTQQVLMDENLIELSNKDPLYIREASKRLMRTALYNDSLFLSDLNIMDYSLVAGVDLDKQELVVGIVDFIRTYTWDKKLESWVKDSAFLGGGSSKPGGPTIVTPKQYKTRFRQSMEAYFLLSPDPWFCSTSNLPLCGQTGSSPDGKTEVFASHPNLPVLSSTAPPS